MNNNKLWFINQLTKLIDDYRKMIKLSTTKRHILIALAHYANKQGETIVSYQRVADFTGLSRRAVMNNILDMELDNILRIEERYKLTGDRTSNKITINLAKLVDNFGEIVTLIQRSDESDDIDLVKLVHPNYKALTKKKELTGNVVSIFDYELQKID